MMFYPNYFVHGYGNIASALSTLGKILGGGVMPLVSLAIYVFTALSLYTIAQKRGIACPWLAWIPVANLWLLGSLSDQYRYLTRGQRRHKRVVLLVLEIVEAVLLGTVAGMAVAVAAVGSASTVIALVLLALVLGCVALARSVVGFMALYDVYASCDPENAALYLVLSILFKFLRPIFLFMSREMERGMPPRKKTAPQEPPAAEEASQDASDAAPQEPQAPSEEGENTIE